ncbi:unnamed protein product [Caretta caretta]
MGRTGCLAAFSALLGLGEEPCTVAIPPLSVPGLPLPPFAEGSHGMRTLPWGTGAADPFLHFLHREKSAMMFCLYLSGPDPRSEDTRTVPGKDQSPSGCKALQAFWSCCSHVGPMIRETR